MFEILPAVTDCSNSVVEGTGQHSNTLLSFPALKTSKYILIVKTLQLPAPLAATEGSWILSWAALVNAQVRELHLINGDRATLGLAVTWCDGSRWTWRRPVSKIERKDKIYHRKHLYQRRLMFEMRRATTYLIVISKIWLSLLCSIEAWEETEEKVLALNYNIEPISVREDNSGVNFLMK